MNVKCKLTQLKIGIFLLHRARGIERGIKRGIERGIERVATM